MDSKVPPKEMFDFLKQLGIDYYLGVPDSLLKDFCSYVTDHVQPCNHIITANEGQAIAIAAGYHLSTQNIPFVYLQNSGLGNIINPIMSLAHPKVYSFPMLLLVGWRGQPGVKDEPQHMVMGESTNEFIKSTQCPSFHLSPSTYKETLQKAYDTANEQNSPVFLTIGKDFFEKYKLKSVQTNEYPLTREQALETIVSAISDGVFVGTTGFLSRELSELREKLNHKANMDFLTVGSMGYASSIALGVALNQQDKTVYCFDGDGAALMHLGCMAIIGTQSPKNLVHFLFNNECHDSVGQQPTCAKSIDFPKIALGCGYSEASVVSTQQEIKDAVIRIVSNQMKQVGPVFLEIKIKPGARDNLGRPKTSTLQNKAALMDYLQTSQS